MLIEKSWNLEQNNKWTSLEKKEVEPVEPLLKNIYQSNTYKKDLSWPHFDDDPSDLAYFASFHNCGDAHSKAYFVKSFYVVKILVDFNWHISICIFSTLNKVGYNGTKI